MLEGFSQMRLRALQLPYIDEENPLTCPNLRGSDLLPSPPEGRPIEKTRQDIFFREHYSGNRRKWVTAFAPGSTSPCLEASCQGGGGSWYERRCYGGPPRRQGWGVTTRAAMPPEHSRCRRPPGLTWTKAMGVVVPSMSSRMARTSAGTGSTPMAAAAARGAHRGRAAAAGSAAPAAPAHGAPSPPLPAAGETGFLG